MEESSVSLVGFSLNGLQTGAAAARLSHSEGSAYDLFYDVEDFNKEAKFFSKIFGMGHSSVAEHISFSFAVDGISLLAEQEIIGNTYFSLTVKSRRYVNHKDTGVVLPEVDAAKLYLFEDINNACSKAYQTMIDSGVPKEDARFILPYSTKSSMFLTGNLRAFVNFIKYCDVAKHISDELKNLALDINNEILTWFEEEYGIDPIQSGLADLFHCQSKLINLSNMAHAEPIRVLKDIERTPDSRYKVTFLFESRANIPFQDPTYNYFPLTSCAPRIIDHNVPFAMKRLLPRATQLMIGERQNKFLSVNSKDTGYPLKSFDSQNLLYALSNYFPHEFQHYLRNIRFSIEWPLISLAGLTHLTRHRQQNLSWTDLHMYGKRHHKYAPIFILPKSIQKNIEIKKLYEDTISFVYKTRQIAYSFPDLRHSLGYTLLSGEMVSAQSEMDMRSLANFLNLRTCTRAQWETRTGANAIHKNLYNGVALHQVVGLEPFNDEGINAFCKYAKEQFGPSCVAKGHCPEGSHGCGRKLGSSNS